MFAEEALPDDQQIVFDPYPPSALLSQARRKGEGAQRVRKTFRGAKRLVPN